jgi:ribosome assembly protein RRB1
MTLPGRLLLAISFSPKTDIARTNIPTLTVESFVRPSHVGFSRPIASSSLFTTRRQPRTHHQTQRLDYNQKTEIQTMGKKSKRRVNSKADDGRLAPGHREEQTETADNLKFEDPYVDEIEDEDVMDAEGDDDAQSGKTDVKDDVELIQSWHPLMGIPTGESQELEMDPTAYKMYHTLSPEWPALSFDFLKDDLGDTRQRFPHSLQAALGTQAGSPEKNRLTILKLSDLSKIAQTEEEDILGDEYDKGADDESSSDEENNVDLDPILEHYDIPHYGGVNRLRAMPQQSDIIATWSDDGNVNLFNVESIRTRFLASEGRSSYGQDTSGTDKPFFSYSGHPTEG